MYLVNPLSGTIKKGPLLFSIKSVTESKGIAYDVEETNAEGNYFLLKEKIQDGGFTDVVVIGGDGTIRQVIHALRHVDNL